MTTSNDKPAPFVTIWAEDGLKFLTIPELRKDRDKPIDDQGTKLQSGRATMEEGFPEITMKSAMRGGIPPWGQDHNKILNKITDAIRWVQAGGAATFNQALCNKINGYPNGAILQSSNITEVQTLWFSIADNNKNDPDTTQSPGNNWVKLDFKDLEARLKKAENDINDIYNNKLPAKADVSRVEAVENDINDIYNNKLPAKADVSRVEAVENDISDIYNNKLPAKADLNGSCSNYFRASNMSAQKYDFGCSTYSEKANSFIQESDGLLNVYTNTAFRIYTKNDKELKNHLFSIEETPNKILDARVDIISFNASMWTQFVGTTSIDGSSFQIRTLDRLYTWETSVDTKTDSRDLSISCFSTSKEDANEILRLCFDNHNIYASSGAFVNGPKGDLAEYYHADRKDYEAGTLMCHGFDTEVTLCKSVDQAGDFFGVVSTDPAFLMNGKGKDETNSVLIALTGKVPVKVKGVVKCGDKITIGQDGYGVVSTDQNDVIVGRAKEDKITKDVGLVSCYVQAHL